MIGPGVATADLDAAAEEVIRKHGGIPVFKGYPGAYPFPATLCVSVNEELVHGFPSKRRLKEGEIVSVDCGTLLEGYVGDAAFTVGVGEISAQARRLLDEGGFPAAKVVASNDLDEQTIASLKEQGARIDVWGVGTRLVTGGEQAALGGVYKLGAVRDGEGRWRHTVKLSEQAAKTSNPGVQQVRRFSSPDGFTADMIYDEASGPPAEIVIVDPLDPTRRKRLPRETPHEDLLRPLMRGGRAVAEAPPLEEARARVKEQLDRLHPGIKRFVHPHQYPVGLSRELHDLKTRLILEQRGERV
jgi:hypothetical protein